MHPDLRPTASLPAALPARLPDTLHPPCLPPTPALAAPASKLLSARCSPPRSPRCSVLDAWVKGSVLFNGAVYLEDTLNRRQSRWLTLDGAAKGDAKVLAGPTDDGWYHVQVRG